MSLTDKHKVKRQRLDRICEGKKKNNSAISSRLSFLHFSNKLRADSSQFRQADYYRFYFMVNYMRCGCNIDIWCLALQCIKSNVFISGIIKTLINWAVSYLFIIENILGLSCEQKSPGTHLNDYSLRFRLLICMSANMQTLLMEINLHLWGRNCSLVFVCVLCFWSFFRDFGKTRNKIQPFLGALRHASQ